MIQAKQLIALAVGENFQPEVQVAITEFLTKIKYDNSKLIKGLPLKRLIEMREWKPAVDASLVSEDMLKDTIHPVCNQLSQYHRGTAGTCRCTGH